MFFIIAKSEETFSEFLRNSVNIYKNVNAKIVNLLNSSENEFSKFGTKKWYVIKSKSKRSYSHHRPIKFLTKSVESSLFHYSDADILVTGKIVITGTMILLM